MKSVNRMTPWLFAAAISLNLISCGDDDEVALNEFAEGVFVVNEGNFQEGDGSITHFNHQSDEVTFEIFSVNNQDQPLGDIVQSMALNDSRGYIVVNNSNKVEVVNYETMEGIATISDVSLPRYMTFNGDKGYLSEWVSFSEPGRIAVINLENNTISKTIKVGFGAEYVLIEAGNLYVSNTFESTISVIDLASEEVVETIAVAPSPGYILKDSSGDLWVACAGGFNADFTPANDGALVKIDPASNTVIRTLEYGSNASGKIAMNNERNRLYYTLGNEVYSIATTASTLPAQPIITNPAFVGVYGIGVNPENNEVYIADNLGFQTNGLIYRYGPDGSFIDTFEAGRGPNGFTFIP